VDGEEPVFVVLLEVARRLAVAVGPGPRTVGHNIPKAVSVPFLVPHERHVGDRRVVVMGIAGLRRDDLQNDC
jgi:hypothetical protein